MKYHQKQKFKQKIFAVIALVIALIMVLSLLTPVFAAAPNTQTVTAVTNTFADGLRQFLYCRKSHAYDGHIDQ